jgi:hypothetical protein
MGTDSKFLSTAFHVCFNVPGLSHPSHRTAYLILLQFFKVVNSTVENSFCCLSLISYQFLGGILHQTWYSDSISLLQYELNTY